MKSVTDMNADAFVSHLYSRGIQLIADGDALVVRPASHLTEQDRKTLRSCKAEILAALGVRDAIARHDVTRSKVANIEQEALAKGWPSELLWKERFWDLPRGLLTVLQPEDEITGVTTEFIEILRCRRDVLRFRRTST